MTRTRASHTARSRRFLVAIAFATAFLGSPATAEPVLDADLSPPAAAWARKGFSLGLGFVSDNIGAEDPGPSSDANQLFVDEHGGGVVFRVAYAFSPQVDLGLSLAGASHATTIDELEVVHATFAFDLRYSFLPAERARPYIEGGLGGATLALNNDEYDVEVRGGVALLGAGVVYNVTRHLRLDGGARLEFINWTEVRVTRHGESETVTLEDPVEDDGGAVKLTLGLGWAF